MKKTSARSNHKNWKKKFRWWAALREILEQQEERNPLRDGKGNG